MHESSSTREKRHVGPELKEKKKFTYTYVQEKNPKCKKRCKRKKKCAYARSSRRTSLKSQRSFTKSTLITLNFFYYDNSCANIKENSGNDNDIVYTHLDN